MKRIIVDFDHGVEQVRRDKIGLHHFREKK